MAFQKTLSVSQMNRFMSCPLSYRFKYIDGIETSLKSSSLALGTAFHAAAEHLHKSIIADEIEPADSYSLTFDNALDTEFASFDIALKDGETEDSLRKAGRELVVLYCEHRLAQPGNLLAVEWKVQGDLANPVTGEVLEVPFLGYIDLLEETPEGPLIVDLKTACRSYNQGDVDSSIQITAYALLLHMETGALPKCRIDAIIRNKKPKVQSLETTRSMKDYERFFALAKSVWRSICVSAQHDCFYPNRGWMCSTCEFKSHCNSWGNSGGNNA